MAWCFCSKIQVNDHGMDTRAGGKFTGGRLAWRDRRLGAFVRRWEIG
jgi:hypothetical protein